MSTGGLQCGQMAVMFSNVRYRAIDYGCEASARHRLTRNLLMLPVPILLDRSIYPHTGHVQKMCRAPWTHANLRSMCQLELELTGSVLDCLKTKLCGLESLERFGVSVAELGEVVPSSSPVSQGSVRSDKALWLQRAEREAGRHEWRDSFSPADINSACFSYQDLFLPEEMIVSDHLKRFRSRLPPLLKLVQRSKILPVPDPLHRMSGVFFSGRQLEPYDVSCDEPASSLAAQSVEEFRKESILTADSLMFPVGIEQVVVRKRDFMLSITSLHESLNITPEPAEEQSSLIDTLRKATPAGVLDSLCCERFDAPVAHSDVPNRPVSPVPYKSYVEMETDVILSPPDRPVVPDLCLSVSQLAAEPLSPVYRQVLLSDGDREAVEKAVWMAEKHPHCVAEFLLAEPQIPSPSVRSQSLPELLSLLQAERETQSTDLLTNPQRLSTFTLLPQKPSQWSLTEPMSVEKHTVPDTGEDPTEQFSFLSLIQIDELLKNSAERAVQDLPVNVRKGSVHSKAVLTSVPSRVEAGKTVKFVLLEEAPQKQSTIFESRETATKPTAANEFPPKDTRSGVISSSPVGTENLNHLSENTSKKEDNGHLKTVLNQSPHTPAERHGGMPSKTPKGLAAPEDLEVAKVTSVEQKLEDSLTSTASIPLAQFVRQGGESELNPAALQSSWRNFSVSKPQEDLDLLSWFIMLRTVQGSLVVQKPQQIPLNTAVADPAQKYVRKPTPVLEVSEKAKNSKASLRITEKAFSKTINVQTTENERSAYFELHTLAQPSLSRVCELDQKALRCKNFISLTSEDTWFYLKQQEKLLSMSRGRECVYDDMALLHILVRGKELLLRCDLNTAIDYMEEAQSTCSVGGLKKLLRRLQVLQYMTYRKEEQEPRPRVLHLWEQMNTYLQRNTSTTVLVVTATERVRAELVTALGQVPGSCVSTVPPGGMNKVDSRTVLDSLSCSRSVIVCRQQIGYDFPWQRFSVVLEFDSLCHSTIDSFCSENNINYICFCTATPKTDPAVSPQAYLDSVPFLVFVTEGLLKHSELLHLLESTYNMTLLERSYSQSMQGLGSADRYDVITVDEKTAILLQDLEELQWEKASNSVVIRLSALSLQFSRCWIILHCTEQHSKLVYGDKFNNLVLIYSSFVLFGLKSEDLNIKVFLVRDVADIAWYVYQICLHTLLSSERSVWSWLDRDWFSVLQTEEESCLVCFPCINPMVSQLMLRRAPSLQWLLEASFSELKDKFPEIPHKVCKLFSDVTALNRLSAAPCPSEPENTTPLQSNYNLCPPHHPHPQHPHWAVNGDEPHSDSLTDTQLFLTSSSTELSSPESVQQQGTVGTGWHGTVCGASVGQSECVCNSHFQPWPGEDAQNEGYTDSFGEEDQWTVDASSLSGPDLSYSHTRTLHTERPAPAVLFGQISPVGEMEMLPLPLWRNSACGTSSRGQQCNTYSISPQYQWGTERKRPARDTAGETVFPQRKRGRLLFERIPGRCDGQTRLRFF